MRNALKLMIIGSVAGLTLAGPAFAQTYNPADGSANAAPFEYAPAEAPQYQAFRHAGREAYAQAPERGFVSQPAAGNDSPGYESLLDTQGTR
jgi:hypothetical protein